MKSARNVAFENKEHEKILPGHEQEVIVPGQHEEFLRVLSKQIQYLFSTHYSKSLWTQAAI